MNFFSAVGLFFAGVTVGILLSLIVRNVVEILWR